MSRDPSRRGFLFHRLDRSYVLLCSSLLDIAVDLYVRAVFVYWITLLVQALMAQSSDAQIWHTPVRDATFARSGGVSNAGAGGAELSTVDPKAPVVGHPAHPAYASPA